MEKRSRINPFLMKEMNCRSAEHGSKLMENPEAAEKKEADLGAIEHDVSDPKE